MAVKKIEIQDSVGDVYHPHTTSDVVFHNGEALAELLKSLIRKDGSIAFETGESKGIKLGNNMDIVEVDGSLYIRNKTNPNDIKNIQITSDGFVLPAGNLKLGSPNYTWRDAWVGSLNAGENGYCKLTNGLIMQWGRGSIESGYSSGAGYFPIAFPTKCLFVVGNPWITQGHTYTVSSPLGLLIKDNTYFSAQTWDANDGKMEYSFLAIGY